MTLTYKVRNIMGKWKNFLLRNYENETSMINYNQYSDYCDKETGELVV
jgi:hypothetical protein